MYSPELHKSVRESDNYEVFVALRLKWHETGLMGSYVPNSPSYDEQDEIFITVMKLERLIIEREAYLRETGRVVKAT